MRGYKTFPRMQVTIKTYKEDRERLKSLLREINFIENSNNGIPELIRRALNVPQLPDILKKDAEIKRGSKRG